MLQHVWKASKMGEWIPLREQHILVHFIFNVHKNTHILNTYVYIYIKYLFAFISSASGGPSS